MWYYTNNKTSSKLLQGSHIISPWLITPYPHSYHWWVRVLIMSVLQTVQIYFLDYWQVTTIGYLMVMPHSYAHYLLVTHPPLTILMWLLESWWLTNMCSFLAVMWTCWFSSTSPLCLLIVLHDSFLVMHDWSLYCSLWHLCVLVTFAAALLYFSLRVYKSVCWQHAASDLTSFIVLLYLGRSQ